MGQFQVAKKKVIMLNLQRLKKQMLEDEMDVGNEVDFALFGRRVFHSITENWFSVKKHHHANDVQFNRFPSHCEKVNEKFIGALDVRILFVLGQSFQK